MPLDLPTHGIGFLATVVTFVRRIPKLWGLAAFEAQLDRDRAQAIADRAKISLLMQKDAEIESSPTRAVSLAIEGRTHGYWQTQDMLEININFSVRNAWIYPITLVKVTGQVNFDNWREVCDFPTYDDEAEIAGLSGRSVQRKVRWTPSTQQKQRLQQMQDRRADISLELRAYLVWRDGKKFQVPATLNAEVVLYSPGG